MSPTMQVLLCLYSLVVYTRLISGDNEDAERESDGVVRPRRLVSCLSDHFLSTCSVHFDCLSSGEQAPWLLCSHPWQYDHATVVPECTDLGLQWYVEVCMYGEGLLLCLFGCKDLLALISCSDYNIQTPGIRRLVITSVHSFHGDVLCVTIKDVGTDLVWSDDHGLDMRGHCSFTFSMGFCGAFRLELYPDKSLSLPKYEIFIDRDSLNKYQVGIKKYCDRDRRLCTNDGMGTLGYMTTPLVTCAGSTWTPFWISWDGSTVRLGKGNTVGKYVLKQVSDPEFKHIDYVKMGADDTNTSASYMFEPHTGRPKNPDMTCREKATTTTATTTAATKLGDLDGAAEASGTDVRTPVDNCDNAKRPESENLEMVFEKAADDTTLSLSNPDVEGLGSATSGSCAELCASRQTCVLYSISNTGTCRITSACRPQVESETGSTVLFLKYWG